MSELTIIRHCHLHGIVGNAMPLLILATAIKGSVGTITYDVHPHSLRILIVMLFSGNDNWSTIRSEAIIQYYISSRLHQNPLGGKYGVINVWLKALEYFVMQILTPRVGPSSRCTYACIAFVCRKVHPPHPLEKSWDRRSPKKCLERMN